MKSAKCAEFTIPRKVLILELKIVNLFIFTSFLIFIFIFIYLLFLNLGLRFSMISHVTVTVSHITKGLRKFQNNNVISYVNSM